MLPLRSSGLATILEGEGKSHCKSLAYFSHLITFVLLLKRKVKTRGAWHNFLLTTLLLTSMLERYQVCKGGQYLRPHTANPRRSERNLWYQEELCSLFYLKLFTGQIFLVFKVKPVPKLIASTQIAKLISEH